MPPEEAFRRPTSVLIVGNDRALLNWVAYAVAVFHDPGFLWTDVRYPGQEVDADDPMARKVIPPAQMVVRHPDELRPSDASANVAVSAVVRADEPPENLRRLLDFLRLPQPTQQALSYSRPGGRLPVVVLSNSHRLAAFYPADAVTSTVRTILESGAILVMTFADSPPRGRVAFDTLLNVHGSVEDGWRRAKVKVEAAPAEGPFRTGTEPSLGELLPFAEILSRALG